MATAIAPESRSEVPLVEAAQQLGWRYHRALNAILAGQITGRRTSEGRWMVDAESVQRCVARRARAALV